MPKEKTTLEIIDEVNQKINLILTNQGCYTNEDYTTIKNLSQ